MASITIRNLSEEAKQNLRLEAAKNNRSMEEEARLRLSVAAPQPVASLANQMPASLPQMQSLLSKDILLIIGGGIAAYKSLDLIRRLKERGAIVKVLMTAAAQQFITPLCAGALAGGHVYTDLFSREDEQDVGHIRLARDADMIIVAPATADRMAKVAQGIGDDLAGAVLLAAHGPILFAPAMNPAMWQNAATQRNYKTLLQDGIHFIGPENGEMAEKNEAGKGRMSEPLQIVAAVETLFGAHNKPLSGKRAIVTSGPTHEPIDPVRYIANRSSGKQGHAIAAALAHLGADVTLVSGPVSIADPQNVKTIHVETAQEMQQAVVQALPADIGVFVAAVADWRPKHMEKQKIKKKPGEGTPAIEVIENPDILASVGHAANRPKLVIGFAAETFDILGNAQKKLAQKGADIIVANDVSFDPQGQSIMGGDDNCVTLISKDSVERWPEMNKQKVAQALAQKITDLLRA